MLGPVPLLALVNTGRTRTQNIAELNCSQTASRSVGETWQGSGEETRSDRIKYADVRTVTDSNRFHWATCAKLRGDSYSIYTSFSVIPRTAGGDWGHPRTLKRTGGVSYKYQHLSAFWTR